VALTVGQSFRPLEPIALLAARHPGRSPLGVPINRTAVQAGIPSGVDESSWRVILVGPVGSRELGHAELTSMQQIAARLPMACVEGWSVDARWSGVRIRDLVALAGGNFGSSVVVESAERHGVYRHSILPAEYAQHPDTLLALHLAGTRLTLDHGFPARVIAPGRPGVLQTKWVRRIVVSA
jgi:DMSO/TMAO reductase YedYZ molybdopterin-dependent catalytic subunit